jgi:cysteine desulfuration protein SufE
MFSDPTDRSSMLLSYADQFREVPPEVATRPFDCDHHVPQCESDAYAWAVKRPDGTLKLHFAVENPSGVSAKALATILDKTLSGLPASQVAEVSPDIVERIFRQNISMGKGMGLMSMVQAVQALAKSASKS